ncbi:MAG TPA: crosslink repair DNA glycosylase YcaQ family protein, partial [Ktedonobacteraceae bacterium]|nr:crosslink repair DNA glycosylase YcaQ family protein [Ktedonobacteraceae bacterium]
MISISKEVQRRFILGKQGLYPGRRWQGKDGVVQALRAGCVVQVDPLNVVARSQDIVLYGRVTAYQPAHLDAALYTDRLLFDYGGAVMIHPMEELPYWRVVMERKRHEPRWATFAREYGATIDEVLAAIRERGPLGTRAFTDETVLRKSSFRSGKVTSQALYYLWLAGELMTHSRQGFDRVYDIRDRVAPAAFNFAASPEEAENFFALKIFHGLGMATAREFRGWFAGRIERSVDTAEAAAWLDAMQKAGQIVPGSLEGDAKATHFLLADDLRLLETLRAGAIPDEWKSVDTTTSDDMILLAPLEIVNARGRGQLLFDFDYLWEVYKPAEKRRWGYYTLPILYQDRLVARLDPRFERASGTLLILGFWLESDVTVDSR